jgi:hypothetical protein
VPLKVAPTTLPTPNATAMYSAPIKPAAVPACLGNGVTEPDCETGKLTPCAHMVRNIAPTTSDQCARPKPTAVRNSAPAASDKVLPMRSVSAGPKRGSRRRQMMVPPM